MEEKILNIGKRPAVDFIRERLGVGLTGAEVGVNKGHHAAYICNMVKPEILYLIDPWSNFFDPASGEIIGEAQYITATALLSSFSCCKIIKGMSYDVVKQFADDSLDFVYIDADHSYQAALSDIMRWYPKIKKGGIVSGHDFQLVEGAIEFFCKKSKIDKLYTQNEDWWLIK